MLEPSGEDIAQGASKREGEDKCPDHPLRRLLPVIASDNRPAVVPFQKLGIPVRGLGHCVIRQEPDSVQVLVDRDSPPIRLDQAVVRACHDLPARGQANPFVLGFKLP